MDDGRIGLPGGDGLPAEGSFVEEAEFAAAQREVKLIRFGRNALIGEKAQTVGGWRKPYYAHSLARI